MTSLTAVRGDNLRPSTALRSIPLTCNRKAVQIAVLGAPQQIEDERLTLNRLKKG